MPGVEVVDSPGECRDSHFLTDAVAETVDYLEVALVGLLVAPSQVVGIAVGRSRTVAAEVGDVGILEVGERRFPPSVPVAVLDAHVRVVLQPHVVVEVEEVVVGGVGLNAEGHLCESHLDRLPVVERVAYPAVLQHAATRS